MPVGYDAYVKLDEVKDFVRPYISWDDTDHLKMDFVKSITREKNKMDWNESGLHDMEERMIDRWYHKLWQRIVSSMSWKNSKFVKKL